MPDWLKILLSILISLIVIFGFAITAYLVYKKLNTPGTCNFVAFTPSSKLSLRLEGTDPNYVQAGYIQCGGGGAMWKPENVKVNNLGPGTFYLGPLPGYTTLQELDAGASITFDMSKNGFIPPNVLYDSSSTNKIPNLQITCI
jgi:hypothetical protein